MATYQVTGPDGHKYRVTGPDGATDEQVLGQIEAYSKQSPTPEPGIPDSKPMAPTPRSTEDAGGSFFNKLPGALNPIARAAVAYGEAGLAAATGAAAPAVGVARSVMDGKYGTQAGVREAEQTTGYQPRTAYGQRLTQAVGEIGAKVPGAEYMPALGGMTGELSALGRSVPSVTRAAGDVVAARPRMAPLPPTGAGAGRGNGILATLKGEPAAAARTEAAESMRKTLIEQASNEYAAETQRLAAKKAELTAQAQAHAKQQATSMGQAHEYESRAAQMQRDIDAQHAEAQRAAEQKHAAAVQAAEQQHAAVVSQVEALGKQVEGKLAEATTHEELRDKLQGQLDSIATSGTLPDLSKQGDTVRDAFTAAMKAADAERKRVTTPLYAEADKAALAREQDGARISVDKATAGAKALREKADNLPDLANALDKLIGAVEGTPVKSGAPAPLGKGKVTSRVTKPKPTGPTEGLTYQELKLANQKLKDIGYSGDTQGYDGITRRAALDISHKLDEAINKFVPEHAEAAAEYRRLSEAMDAQQTRIGKLITGEEGGLKGETYSKVAGQKIPDAVFKTREGIELLTDALAGGVKGEARAAAEAQVNQMVENWILTSVRGSGGTYGTKALEKLRAPQTAATLTAVPKVAEKVAGQFAAEAGTEAQIAAADERARAARGEAGELSKVRAPLERQAAAGPEKVAPPKVEKPDTSKAEQSMSELAASSKKARAEATTAAGKRAEAEAAAGEVGKAPVTSKTLEKIGGALSDADALGKMQSPKYQKKAFDEYVTTMRDLVKQGVLPKDKFEAALAMVDRAEGLQAKTDRARSIAWKIAQVLGVAAAADVGIKLVP